MKDRVLRQSIIAELEFEPSIDGDNIGVTVDDGVVTLSGYVSTYAQKVTAENVAKRVKGVAGIAQEIEVRLDGSQIVHDDELAKQALVTLAFDVLLPVDAIQVKAAKGHLTLTGEVDWQFQRDLAVEDLRRMRGVVGIANDITLRPRASAADIEHRIKAALERDASIDADDIHVQVDGARVTLAGKVDCWRDRDVVERACWAAPGVRNVVDYLHVG